jgi:ABC-2 type transport system ATP-binding protein
MDAAILVRGLRKCYGDFEAVRGIDFEVARGEVFALLGPNGAGKTTTIEILEGLRPRTAGDVSVLGFDPEKNVRLIKDRIGAALQSTNLPDKITVREAVVLFASFYTRRSDLDGILNRLQLWDKRNSYYGQLSGGQKQRLALALALVNDPELLFLDEPTTGLDPQVRLEIHTLIQELRGNHRTIVLTTHYIEEAERLCDRVAIVDQGQMIALGTPREIQERTLGHSFIEVHVEPAWPECEVPASVQAERVHFGPGRKSMVVTSAHPTRSLIELVKWIDQQQVEVADIQLKRPTLEDVFLELTGKKLRQ